MPCMNNYSIAASQRLDNIINKFYINVGALNIHNGNINNGIQHSIAAERTGDIHVHSQTIDNRMQQFNYTINLDNRKVEVIPQYLSSTSGRRNYLEGRKTYLLSAPNSDNYEKRALSDSYQSMITAGLLNSRRPVTQWIGDAKEIEDLAIETFEKLTSQPFPEDIIIRVCAEKEMKKAHAANGGVWSSGIMGFAINRTNEPSLIFVRQNYLDALMLTLGHELGHVLTTRLPNAHDEEAKAFAFEIAWVKTIIENNIGNLAQSFNIDFTPAQNGLHDRAFSFVQNKLRAGKAALKVFWELARGVLKMPSEDVPIVGLI
jgi:hypothetical protein